MTVLAGALEFAALLSGAKGKDAAKKLSKKERKEKQGRIEELEALLEARREELGISERVAVRQEDRAVVGSAAQRRARVLLWGHLLRYDFDEQELKDGQLVATFPRRSRLTDDDRATRHPSRRSTALDRPNQYRPLAQLALDITAMHAAAIGSRPSCTSRSLAARSTAETEPRKG